MDSGGDIPFRPATMETCPDGYKRPYQTDYLISIVYNIIYNTSLRRYIGYYADGFFDRRNIPMNGVLRTGDSPNMASAGVVIAVNASANRGHSLFFPNTGYRAGKDGTYPGTRYPVLTNGRIDGLNSPFCWTSDPTVLLDDDPLLPGGPADMAHAFGFTGHYADFAVEQSAGMAIRCVKE
jgi:hypothetical protein